MKPRIRLNKSCPNTNQWECVSFEITNLGRRFECYGKGYSPLVAYKTWLIAATYVIEKGM